MTITVELWGQLKQRAGKGEFQLELPEKVLIEDAVRAIAAQEAALADMLLGDGGACRVTNLVFVNSEQAMLGDSLSDGCTLTVMSPVSGG